VDRAWVVPVVVAEEVAVALALAGSVAVEEEAAEAANDPSESNNCRFRPRPDIWRWALALGGVEFLVRFRVRVLLVRCVVGGSNLAKEEE
jgi:hypothetical protein